MKYTTFLLCCMLQTRFFFSWRFYLQNMTVKLVKNIRREEETKNIPNRNSASTLILTLFEKEKKTTLYLGIEKANRIQRFRQPSIISFNYALGFCSFDFFLRGLELTCCKFNAVEKRVKKSYQHSSVINLFHLVQFDIFSDNLLHLCNL